MTVASRLNLTHDVVAVDIGGTHVSLSHIRPDGIPSNGQTVSSQLLRTPQAAVALANLLEGYIQSCNLDVGFVVVGVPGMLDYSRRSISHCNNIPGLEGSGLLDFLEQRLGCRVIFEQDIMLQLLGEWRSGAARDSQAVFGVYFGTGIGTAYLRGGDPYRRASSNLQAGHIPVSNRGKPCLCGNLDCVEAYASGHTLKELAEQHDIEISQLFTSSGNTVLNSALEEFIGYQSRLLATLITVTEPDAILVGGGIPAMPGYPRDKLISEMRKHLQRPHPADTTAVAWAELESLSPIYGALALIEINTTQSGITQ